MTRSVNCSASTPRSPGRWHAKDGCLLINTRRTPEELGIASAVANLPAGRVCTVPATEIAMKFVKRPVPNAVLLGALCAVTGVLKIDSVVSAIETKFPGKVGELNIVAAKAAYESVLDSRQAA